MVSVLIAYKTLVMSLSSLGKWEFSRLHYPDLYYEELTGHLQLFVCNRWRFNSENAIHWERVKKCVDELSLSHLKLIGKPSSLAALLICLSRGSTLVRVLWSSSYDSIPAEFACTAKYLCYELRML